MRAERCVVDTNVLISALLQPSGRTAAALDAIRALGGVLMFSDEAFAELAARLARPKFDRDVDQVIRRQFLSRVNASAAKSVQASRSRPYATLISRSARALAARYGI